MGTLIIILLSIVVLSFPLVAKVVWMAGFNSGTAHEARYWLYALDQLRVPNWQSLPLTEGTPEEGATPDQEKLANQIFVKAYALALDRISREIGMIRLEELRKQLAGDVTDKRLDE